MRKMRKKKRHSGLKRRSKFFIPLVILVVVWFALFDDDVKKDKGLKEPKAIMILTPVIADVENVEDSKRLFLEGKKHYEEGGYANLLLAAAKFKASVEQKYLGNEAIYWLLKVYSEAVEEASDKVNYYHNVLADGQSSNSPVFERSCW